MVPFTRHVVPLHRAQRGRDRCARCMLVVCAIVGFTTTPVTADSVQLRDKVQVESTRVQLQDIAHLEGDRVKQYANIIVATVSDRHETRVTLQQVRQALQDKGVNWSYVSLRGFRQCVVYHTPRIEPATEPITSTAASTSAPPTGPATANPVEPVDTRSALTLGAYVMSTLRSLIGGDAEQITIDFADHYKDTLNLALNTDRVEVEPKSQSLLGRVPIVVRVYRQDASVTTHRLSAEIARKQIVAVAVRAISRGDLLGHDDIVMREVELTSDRTRPVLDPRDVIGQRAVMLLRPDTTIDRAHLAPPIVVTRGQVVTVKCLINGVTVTTVARAMSAGSVGEVIDVRNERSRRTYPCRIASSGVVMTIQSDHEKDEAMSTLASEARATKGGSP